MTAGLVTAHAVVDGVLEQFAVPASYRNHVYRGLNYQRKLLQLNDIPDEIALAWALHDIELPTVGWDYLGPSLRHIDQQAREYGIDDAERVRQMVALHHKVRPCRDDEWVETFRVADRIDVSRGLLTAGLARSEVADIVRTFPYLGFHGMLVRTATPWVVRHPLRPMPMLRW